MEKELTYIGTLLWKSQLNLIKARQALNEAAQQVETMQMLFEKIEENAKKKHTKAPAQK